MRVLKLKEVMEKTGLGRTKVYELQAEGRFPKSISLDGRAVGWLENEVEDWLQERVDVRNAAMNRQRNWASVSQRFCMPAGKWCSPRSLARPSSLLCICPSSPWRAWKAKCSIPWRQP